MSPFSTLLRISSRGVAFLGICASLCGVASASPALQTSLKAQATPLKIVAFGSSSTEGVGASKPAFAYPAQLQVLLDRLLPPGQKVEVVNRGIGGEDADDMLRRLQSDVIARHPDLVIWQTGSNDPLRHVPLDRFVSETRQGIALMRRAGIRIILMEPQWCPRLDASGGAAAYRDAIRAIGREDHVEVVRRSDLMHDWVRQGLLTPHQLLSADGLHMTDSSYALLAKSVVPEVLKLADGKLPLSRPVAPAVLDTDK